MVTNMTIGGNKYDEVDRRSIAGSIADWTFMDTEDIDNCLSVIEDVLGPLDFEDYESPETLENALASFDLETLQELEDRIFNDFDIEDSERYKFEKSKSVMDSNGFYTDYTMYRDRKRDVYVFILGDNDIYNPDNTEPDWEVETRILADEWFNDYNGFDDSLDESFKLKINEVDQKYNSAITSINSSKLPAVFSKVKFRPDTINLDYGGGKFDNATEYLKDKYNVTNLVYDKYNRSSTHNNEVLRQIKDNGGADTVTCSNVLNVIAEPEIRQEVIKGCYDLLKPNGTCYITVYEGSGTGEGKANDKRQSYQTNMKLDDYISEVSNVFPNVKKSKGMLVCTK